MTAEELAKQFHETYEALAPRNGYETRPETRVFNPESPNGRLMIAVCNEILKALREQLALAKQVAIQSQEDAKAQYRKRIALEKFIEGKNGYKERIEQLYEENLRLGNEQIDLADKVREECAATCECEKLGENEYEADRAYNMAIKHCTAAIRAMKERP